MNEEQAIFVLLLLYKSVVLVFELINGVVELVELHFLHFEVLEHHELVGEGVVIALVLLNHSHYWSERRLP